MIENSSLSEEQRAFLSFFVSNIEKQKNEIIYQINHAKIETDSSPFYHIIKFSYEGSSNLLDNNYEFASTVQILHDNGFPPIVMILFAKNGKILDFDLSNADLTEIDYSKIYDGSVFKQL